MRSPHGSDHATGALALAACGSMLPIHAGAGARGCALEQELRRRLCQSCRLGPFGEIVWCWMSGSFGEVGGRQLSGSFGEAVWRRLLGSFGEVVQRRRGGLARRGWIRAIGTRPERWSGIS